MEDGRVLIRQATRFLTVASLALSGLITLAACTDNEGQKSEYRQTSGPVESGRDYSQPRDGGVDYSRTDFFKELELACGGAEPDVDAIVDVLDRNVGLLADPESADMPMLYFGLALSCIDDADQVGFELMDELDISILRNEDARPSSRSLFLAETSRLHFRSGTVGRGRFLLNEAVNALGHAYETEFSSPGGTEPVAPPREARVSIALVNHIRRAWQSLERLEPTGNDFASYIQQNELLAENSIAMDEVLESASQPAIYIDDLDHMSFPCSCDKEHAEANSHEAGYSLTDFFGELEFACEGAEPDLDTIVEVLEENVRLLADPEAADMPMLCFGLALSCFDHTDQVGSELMNDLEVAVLGNESAMHSSRYLFLAESSRLHFRSGAIDRGRHLLDEAANALGLAYESEFSTAGRARPRMFPRDPRESAAFVNHIRRAWQSLENLEQSGTDFLSYIQQSEQLAENSFAMDEIRQSASHADVYIHDLKYMSYPCNCD